MTVIWVAYWIPWLFNIILFGSVFLQNNYIFGIKTNFLLLIGYKNPWLTKVTYYCCIVVLRLFIIVVLYYRNRWGGGDITPL